MKWLLGLGVLSLFKRKKAEKGEWKDLKEKKVEKENDYRHDFEIKRDVGFVDTEEKKGFFKRLFSRKKIKD